MAVASSHSHLHEEARTGQEKQDLLRDLALLCTVWDVSLFPWHWHSKVESKTLHTSQARADEHLCCCALSRRRATSQEASGDVWGGATASLTWIIPSDAWVTLSATTGYGRIGTSAASNNRCERAESIRTGLRSPGSLPGRQSNGGSSGSPGTTQTKGICR